MGKTYGAALLGLAISVLLAMASPARALTVEQVLELRKAGVSNETIALMLDHETKTRKQGGVGRYVVTGSQGREIIVYEASSPRGVVDYSLGAEVSQALPFSRGRTVVVPREQVTVTEQGGARVASILEACPRDQEAAPNGYTLHVASFREAEGASAFARRLEEAGLKVKVAATDMGDKGRWYRILVGGFTTRAEAEKEARRLIQQGLIDYYQVTSS